MARAFRRFTNSKRRFGNRSSRLQTPHRPRKWERGNMYFNIDHEFTSGTGDSLLTILPIAQTNRIVDGQATDVGRALSAATRNIEVGGLVYDYVISKQNFTGFFPPAQGDIGTVDSRILLVSDRLDSSTPPQPVCLQTNWFTNTQPLTTVNENQDEQQTFPTQIHRQHFRRHDFSSLQLSDVAGDYPAGQAVESIRGTANVRLRLRLADDEVLAFHFASQVPLSEEIRNCTVRMSIIGTIFYRFVLGTR